MSLAVKATCDGGSEHSGPFFSVYIRVAQIGSRKEGRLIDRLKTAGIFCFGCLDSGSVTLPVPAGIVSGVQLPLLGGKTAE